MTDTTADATSTAGRHERTRIERYDPSEIEPRWQQRWDELELYHTDLDEPRSQVLPADDVPVPVGRPPHRALVHQDADRRDRPLPADARRQRVPADRLRRVRAARRERRDRGNRINPRDWTMSNIENMRRQLRQMGATFDWSAEVVTCDPDYYRWNQWFFLQFLEAGLAYRAMSPVDWCPKDGTLAREQVEGADRHLLALRREGREARPRAVVPAHHEVRGRAARLQRDRLARAGPDPADELDRAVRGRRDRVRHGAVRPPRRAARSCGSSRRGRTRCSGPRSWSWRPSIRWSRS